MNGSFNPAFKQGDLILFSKPVFLLAVPDHRSHYLGLHIRHGKYPSSMAVSKGIEFRFLAYGHPFK
jgi:hypothetical protein